MVLGDDSVTRYDLSKKARPFQPRQRKNDDRDIELRLKELAKVHNEELTQKDKQIEELKQQLLASQKGNEENEAIIKNLQKSSMIEEKLSEVTEKQQKVLQKTRQELNNQEINANNCANMLKDSMRAMDPTLQLEQANLSELTEMCCAFMLQFHNELCSKEKSGVKRTFGQIYRSSSEAMKHEDQLRASKESKKMKKEDGS